MTKFLRIEELMFLTFYRLATTIIGHPREWDLLMFSRNAKNFKIKLCEIWKLRKLQMIVYTFFLKNKIQVLITLTMISSMYEKNLHFGFLFNSLMSILKIWFTIMKFIVVFVIACIETPDINYAQCIIRKFWGFCQKNRQLMYKMIWQVIYYIGENWKEFMVLKLKVFTAIWLYMDMKRQPNI